MVNGKWFSRKRWPKDSKMDNEFVESVSKIHRTFEKLTGKKFEKPDLKSLKELKKMY